MSKLRVIAKIRNNKLNVLKRYAQTQPPNNSQDEKWLADPAYYDFMSKNRAGHAPNNFVNEMQTRIPSSLTPNTNVYKNSQQKQNILEFFWEKIQQLDAYIQRTDITEQQRQNARAHKYYIMVQSQAIKNKFGIGQQTDLNKYYNQYVNK